MKIGDKQGPQICALVMHECQQVYNNDYSKHAFYWCPVAMAELTGKQQQQSVYAPRHTCRTCGLLMVHATGGW